MQSAKLARGARSFALATMIAVVVLAMVQLSATSALAQGTEKYYDCTDELWEQTHSHCACCLQTCGDGDCDWETEFCVVSCNMQAGCSYTVDCPPWGV